MLKLILWGVANPLEFGAIFASAIAIVRGIYAVITRLVAPYPRLRAVVEGFAALGPDVLRFALQLARAITGRAIPSPALDSRDAELASLRAKLGELEGLRAEVLRLRAVLVAPRPLAVTLGDEVVLGRETIAPPDTIDPERFDRFDPTQTRRSERGSVDLRSLALLACTLGALGSAGVLCMGCPASAQLTRPALGDVDGCEPRTTRCAPNGRPQVCSGSRRWTDADQVCALAVQVAAVCCLTTSPITGAELHACVLADRCIDRDGGL
ncbi:MAG: hypothetical protein JWM10_1928 [Myxococcaceae bacterium]|nr:hypothetical protein [Myxococcaceae bacterium]